MKAKILWIEGKRAESPSFVPGLRKKDYVVEIVPTGKAALVQLQDDDHDLVVVNAASLRTSGKRICKSLTNNADDLPVILISSPDYPVFNDVTAAVVLNLPFTLRKLVNRIRPLIPAEGGDSMQAGSIRLDLERNMVQSKSKETTLTPRLVHLLKVLMERAGEVVARDDLFRKVWKTEYIGDTRTLDVHISWLRRAIEEDPRNPKLLKTIRGVGYRLDV